MKKEFENIAIVVKPNLTNSKEFAEEIRNKLNEELKPGVFDLLITIGGDGTILAVSRNIDERTPILGILIGGRGILSEVIIEEIDQAFELLKKKEYEGNISDAENVMLTIDKIYKADKRWYNFINQKK